MVPPSPWVVLALLDVSICGHFHVFSGVDGFWLLIQDHPNCCPYWDIDCSRRWGYLVILCTIRLLFEVFVLSLIFCIVLQNIFSTQDHAAAAWVFNCSKIRSITFTRSTALPQLVCQSSPGKVKPRRNTPGALSNPLLHSLVARLSTWFLMTAVILPTLFTKNTLSTWKVTKQQCNFDTPAQRLC